MPDPRARFLITAQDRATAVLRGVGKQVGKLGSSFTKLNGLVAALAGGGFGLATKSALNFADAIADASEKTAFSSEQIQELKFAAEQNGVSFRELENGLARFTKRLGLARAGAGAAAKTYEKLGINLDQTNRQVFEQVVETLGSMDDETNRLALTTRLFGDDAQRLGVVFRNGNQGLRQFADRARELGLVLSDDLVQGASDANDQLDIMRSVIQAQLTRGLVSLAPVITKVGQAFADAAVGVAKFFESFDEPSKQGIDVVQRSLDASNERLDKLRDRARRAQEIRQPKATRGRSLTGEEVFGGLLGNYDPEKIRREIEKELERNTQLQLRILEIQKEFKDTPKPEAVPVDTGLLFGATGGRRSNQLTGASDAQERLNKLIAAGAAITEAARTPQEVYLEQVAKLNLLLDQGALSKETFNRAIAQYKEELSEATGETEKFAKLQQVIAEVDPVAPLLAEIAALEELAAAYPEYIDLIKEAVINRQIAIDEIISGSDEIIEKTDEVEAAWQGLGPIMSSAFEDAIVAGAKFGDLLKGLEQDLIRLFARNLVTKPLEGFLSPSGAGGSFLNNLFGGLFGGARAEGGPVAPGQTYLVGEQGPELFVPTRAGEILSHPVTTAVARDGMMEALPAKQRQGLFEAARRVIGRPVTEAMTLLYGGARAQGGPVAPGQAYLVGEQGPELFVPRSAGQVTGNNGDGPSIVNHFSFVLPSDGIDHRRSGQQVAREAARYMQLANGSV